MTHEDFMRAAEECRQSMRELAKLYPGCFHADGTPIVATAHFPTARELQDAARAQPQEPT